MKKIILGLCLLSLILIIGCSPNQNIGDIDLPLPDVDNVVCNADNVGSKAKADCNTCTCVYDKNYGYGWTCTEIGCNAMPLI